LLASYDGSNKDDIYDMDNAGGDIVFLAFSSLLFILLIYFIEKL